MTDFNGLLAGSSVENGPKVLAQVKKRIAWLARAPQPEEVKFFVAELVELFENFDPTYELHHDNELSVRLNWILSGGATKLLTKTGGFGRAFYSLVHQLIRLQIVVGPTDDLTIVLAADLLDKIKEEVIAL